MRLSKIISSSVFEVRNSKVRNLHLTLDIYRPFSITTTLLQSNTCKIQLGTSNSVELFTKFFLNSQRCKAYPSELNGWILHIIWLDYILYRGLKIKKMCNFCEFELFFLQVKETLFRDKIGMKLTIVLHYYFICSLLYTMCIMTYKKMIHRNSNSLFQNDYSFGGIKPPQFLFLQTTRFVGNTSNSSILYLHLMIGNQNRLKCRSKFIGVRSI